MKEVSMEITFKNDLGMDIQITVNGGLVTSVIDGGEAVIEVEENDVVGVEEFDQED